MAVVTVGGKPVTIHLKPSAEAVLNVLRSHPGGVCARTFAEYDIYRFGARIHELRQLGWLVGSHDCTTHLHSLPAYTLEGFHESN